MVPNYKFPSFFPDAVSHKPLRQRAEDRHHEKGMMTSTGTDEAGVADVEVGHLALIDHRQWTDPRDIDLHHADDLRIEEATGDGAEAGEVAEVGSGHAHILGQGVGPHDEVIHAHLSADRHRGHRLDAEAEGAGMEGETHRPGEAEEVAAAVVVVGEVVEAGEAPATARTGV